MILKKGGRFLAAYMCRMGTGGQVIEHGYLSHNPIPEPVERERERGLEYVGASCILIRTHKRRQFI